MNMSSIKAPYNFVPFNEKIVSPDWANAISHDLPFQDGLSGEIEITLTAESPVFVKNGLGQQEANFYKNDSGHQIKDYTFNKWKDKYFIPGTSIKGMVRNVLEIMTFGNMEAKVNDHKYSLRDLTSRMKAVYLGSFTPNNLYCGWLKKQDESYLIVDCGLPGRISHKNLDEQLGTEFGEFTTKKDNFNSRNNFNKSARKKYELFGSRDRNQSFKKLITNDPRSIYEVDPQGDRKGCLVFTGQPGVRKQKPDGKWDGHRYEFIFFDDANRVERKVVKDVVDNFFFAYLEQDKMKWSDDWKYWRQELDRGNPIPVFFQKDGDKIIHFGLSYLYKLPYKYSVRDLIRKHQQAEGLDMSEAIFGHVQKNNALKGRVTFSHAFATMAEEDEPKHEVLAGPKASYYPNYIRQKLINGNVGRDRSYQTFMDQTAKIAGWKRYPIRKDISRNDGTDNVKTRFIPLKQGAQFACKIHYHNLRPIELGALLSALTFHGSTDTYHSIGMAKPLGYGKVKLSIDKAENIQKEKMMGEFEAYMNTKLQYDEPKWHQLPQITELVTMAQEHPNSDLGYMKLQEHVDAKNAGEALDKYSLLTGVEASINSFCNTADILQIKTQINKESKLNQHQAFLPELISATLSNAKKELEEAFDNKKRELIHQIRERKTALIELEWKIKEDKEQKDREIKKMEIQIKTAQEGLSFSSLNVKKKDAFEQLKKLVVDFCRKYHNMKEVELKSSFPNGFLPNDYRDKLIEKLIEIYHESLNRKEKEKWDAPFENNHVMKKVAEWIGAEKAKNITFK